VEQLWRSGSVVNSLWQQDPASSKDMGERSIIYSGIPTECLAGRKAFRFFDPPKDPSLIEFYIGRGPFL